MDITKITRTEAWRHLTGTATSLIITINTLVWVVVAVGMLFCGSSMTATATWISCWALPDSAATLLVRPWTIATYMFTQFDVLQLIVNMMWLMLFGRLVSMVQGDRTLWALYIYGGLAGAAGFWIFAAVGHAQPILAGSSAAVLAMVGAVATRIPRFRINLVFLGQVQVIWLAVVVVVFYVILSPSATESIVHGSGLAIGAIYGALKNSGIDICRPALWLMGRFDNRTIRPRIMRTEAEEFDDLLRKVSRSGYNSLSADERQRLFELSQKTKR